MKRNARVSLVAAALASVFTANALVIQPAFAQTAAPKSASELVSVTSSEKTGEQRVVFDFAGKAPAVKTFKLANPNRLVLDFLGSANKTNMGAIETQGLGAKSVDLVGDENRLRAVISLHEDTVVNENWEGGKYVLAISRKGAAPLPVSESAPVPAAALAKMDHEIVKLDFRKGKGVGSGRLLVDMTDASTPIDIKTMKNGLVIDFMGSQLPSHLAKKFDLADQMSPISSMEWKQLPDRTRVTLRAQGKWEQSAYQLENRFVFEVRPVYNDTMSKEKMGDQKFKGDKVTLNFQNIEVRTILQVLADFTGMNIITSDSVGGSITLRLKDVPWDQALDLILQSKKLDQRKQGNVVWIAPQDEIRAKEKADAEFRIEQDQNQPMITESFQINFGTSAQIIAILTNPQQRILTKRGSAVGDARTNTVFIQDIPEKIEAARAMIKKIDVPVRQVMIEARIVEASDTFGRSIGARLGYNNTTAPGGNSAWGFNMNNVLARTGQGGTTSLADTWLFNSPSAGSGGVNPAAMAFSIFNSAKTKFLNLELSAMVSDGKGQILSNPRLLTSNNQAATIQQGSQIPYQTATASGATAVTFANAMLSLSVTPQITPDGHVMMNLNVNKNSPGASTSAGPAIDTKSITTQVLVEDGGTVVIGGIYTLDETETEARVPLLGELPYIGWLFKNRATTKARKEMLVFITPKVINNGTGDIDASAESDDDIKPIWIDPALANANGANMPPIRFDYEKRWDKAFSSPKKIDHADR